VDNISYNIEIYDQNFQLLFSDNTQQNSAIISYADLNINIGEINSYSWKILTSDILSETFYFAIDAQSLNNMDYGISQFNLYQNYPNPFNPITSIAFDVPYYSFVDINIYDLNGQLLDNLVETYYGPGSYNVYWDAKYYPSGIYLYEMITNEHVLKKKMVLIK